MNHKEMTYEMFLKLRNKNSKLVKRYGADDSAEIFIAIMNRLKYSVFTFLRMAVEDAREDFGILEDAYVEYETYGTILE